MGPEVAEDVGRLADERAEVVEAVVQVEAAAVDGHRYVRLPPLAQSADPGPVKRRSRLGYRSLLRRPFDERAACGAPFAASS